MSFNRSRGSCIFVFTKSDINMSNINTTATVNLTINGQQPIQVLQQLRQNALQLESAIARAAAAGNRTDLRRLRKELTDT